MDIDKLLDIEADRVKDKDISNFLEKVDDVQEKLRKLMSGELKPEDIKSLGKTEQELKDEEERALRARERAERKEGEARGTREMVAWRSCGRNIAGTFGAEACR